MEPYNILFSLAPALKSNTKNENEDGNAGFLGDDTGADSHVRIHDYDEGGDDRFRRRALWYNPEWVSGYRMEGSENELSQLVVGRSGET